MYYMFSNCEKLTSLNLTHFDTSNVIDMFAMFKGCTNLESLELKSFNTSQVLDMGEMFSGCRKLQHFITINFDVRNVESMSGMFQEVPLSPLDLSNFETINLTDASLFINDCDNLKNIDLRKFNTKKLKKYQDWFPDNNGIFYYNSTIFDKDKFGIPQGWKGININDQ